MTREKMSLPMAAIRGLAILPGMVKHFDISREKTVDAFEQAIANKQRIFLTAQRALDTENPGEKDVYSIGCVATINQIIKLNKKVFRVLVTGDVRAELDCVEFEEPHLQAMVTVLPDSHITELEEDAEQNAVSLEGMLRGLKELFKEYLVRNPKLSKELGSQIEELEDIRSMVDVIAANMQLPFLYTQELLEEVDVLKRYENIVGKLVTEIQVLNVKEEIQAKVKERVDKNQREYILREEVKLIREELGDDHGLSDADEFQEMAKKLKAPKEVKEKLNKEIKRFRNSVGSAAESGVIRTYIETLLEMPWDKASKEHKDITYAMKILDEEHYGLDKVKERILEFLAVRALTKKGDSPILCLSGPPGTGKTSIAKSLAKALKKEYVRISLGGVRDEAEIRGHRRTYVGAMPGRIANGLKSAGVKNPLILLDEIDKVSNDYKGDTFSALLEVLDSEQNVKFRDHYMEVPLDLSEVLFVTTANTLQTIPRPLLDRMEVIEVSSYTENEKIHIAMEHLIPKQLKRHGLNEELLAISKNTVWKMARNYTKEAGVRQLERKIGHICRKAAKEILQTGKKQIRVTERNIHHFLGRELYVYQMANSEDEVGIVRGLAWTSVGGDTLQIEVNIMPGEGEILLTGQLGDVMKESARTGISFIRSIGKEYEIQDAFFKEHDVHIHIPEGAVPKDGPSAGITMATAMISAITNRKVRADIAMTGEITLRGRVLPIGGLKEKLLAAKNAGIKTVLIPKKNESNLEEISTEITRGLQILPVTNMNEVLNTALVGE